NCTDISGATGNTYVLTSGDVGSKVKVAVTATNAGGSTTATSSATAQIVGIAPADTLIPSISGIAQSGHTLAAAPGTWAGSAPIPYTYQWQRCDAAGTGCADIDQAGADTYELGPDDVGLTVRVVVTATNGWGTASTASGPTGSVAA